MLDVRLVGEGILLRKEQRQIAEVTKGNIVLPDVGDSNPVFEVVAVGPGRMLENGQVKPMPCGVGDRVIFVNDSAVMFFDGAPYQWINGYQVIAVLGAGVSASAREQALVTSR